MLSDDLLKLGKYVPKEFSRKTESLSEIGRWKATVLRFFLLYVGPIVLRGQIPDVHFYHFNILNCAIRILCHTTQYRDFNEDAKEMLYKFVKDFKEIYGERYITFNVHNLIHISEECINNDGPLDSFSAFEFENSMQFLKKIIKKHEKPLQQLHRRISEGYYPTKKTRLSSKDHAFEFKDKILSEKCSYKLDISFKQLIFSDYELSTSMPNNCCILKDGKIILISGLGIKDDKYYIIGKTYKNTSSLNNYPLDDSRDVGIYVASSLSKTEKLYEINEIQNKACHFFYKEKFYVVGLLHH